ncbi:Uncharacterized protein FKW44_011568 [Caligus rogercresseyi]|uniref:Uncharacterized protein n=1 Tax=Caligus rogercresseyi TaxID=217165 RepID=A0A7T8HI64_CALRO|nr:Uncharacterized protein FKW44_011568 [Caligus rogercresseyi]
MLRVYNKMFNIGNGGEENFKGIDQTVQSDVRIAAYGDLGNLFRKESNAPVDSWNRPLSKRSGTFDWRHISYDFCTEHGNTLHALHTHSPRKAQLLPTVLHDLR